MRATELAIVYVVIGSSSALAMLMLAKQRRLMDAILLVPFWPLYGPFLLMGAEPVKAGALPDVAELDRRLVGARRRVAEIDVLLQRSEFSEVETSSRQRELETRGDHRAAKAAGARLTNIRRLKALRGRYASELTEVEELMAQLSVQAEILRLSGREDSIRDLVEEVVARVEGLDAMITTDTDESHLPALAP